MINAGWMIFLVSPGWFTLLIWLRFEGGVRNINRPRMRRMREKAVKMYREAYLSQTENGCKWFLRDLATFSSCHLYLSVALLYYGRITEKKVSRNDDGCLCGRSAIVLNSSTVIFCHQFDNFFKSTQYSHLSLGWQECVLLPKGVKIRRFMLIIHTIR